MFLSFFGVHVVLIVLINSDVVSIVCCSAVANFLLAAFLSVVAIAAVAYGFGWYDRRPFTRPPFCWVSLFLLLRGTIVNRTYGTHKILYI